MFGLGRKQRKGLPAVIPAEHAGRSLIPATRATRAAAAKARPAVVRGIKAAESDDLFQGWHGTGSSTDQLIRAYWPMLVRRSRDLAYNDDYMKGFLRSAARNIIGRGVKLQSRVVNSNGSFDKDANSKIEAAWKKWGKKGNPTVCGRMSWATLQRAIVKTVARDGEVLLRRTPGFQNDWRYALQVIPAPSLDITYERPKRDGVSVSLGIERDRWNRATAYYILSDATDGQRSRQRIPANEIVHIFIAEEISQSRGLPWALASMRRLKMLSGYEESALAAARAGAEKLGFLTTVTGDDPAPAADGEEAPKDEKIVIQSTAAHWESLPEGMDVAAWDPKYPEGDMAPFVKLMLRGAAAGLGVSYNGLANDLEGVNFSSLRHGLQDERGEWEVLQDDVIGQLHEQVFPEWLMQSMMAGAVTLPTTGFERFNAAEWIPRGWQWVDPEKEGKANTRDLALGVTSRTRIAAHKGDDLGDIFDEIAAENKLAAEKEIDLADPGATLAAVPLTVEGANDDG